MFMGNPKLRGPDEVIELTPEQEEIYKKCYSDVFEFAKYFFIISPGHGFVPIKLREYQERVLQSFVAEVPGRNYRIVMQGRQTGKTTIASLYLLWRFIFSDHKTIAILANQEDQALEIMKRMVEAYQELPLWMQPGVEKWSQKDKILTTGSRLIAAPSSSASIRGRSVNYLLVDEFAHLDNSVAAEFMDSVMPVVAADEKAQIILISTPKGTNEFYNIWQKARAGLNSFVPVFVAWDEIPGRDENFRNKIIRDRGIRHWNQEYACIVSETLVTVYDEVEKCSKTLKIGDLYEMLEDE